jgi:hypothetical protein
MRSMENSLQQAREVAAKIARSGVTISLKLRLEPSTRVTRELESMVREVAPQLRYLLATEGIEDLLTDLSEWQSAAQQVAAAPAKDNGTNHPHDGNQPEPELTRCRWCGRDPRQPPAVAEQMRRLRQWQTAQPELWQWTQTQLDCLARRLGEGDEITEAFVQSVVVRRADGRIDELFRTDS